MFLLIMNMYFAMGQNCVVALEKQTNTRIQITILAALGSAQIWQDLQLLMPARTSTMI